MEGLQGIHSLPLPGTQGETISSAAQYGKDAREASTLPTCSCCIYGVLRLANLGTKTFGVRLPEPIVGTNQQAPYCKA